MAILVASQNPPSAGAQDIDPYRVGPGTLAGRYLRLFWQPVYVGSELPAGKARPVRIMGEDFTVYRGESGEAHVVDFRCAHRRTQLSIGWVEGDNIRCRYHGWAYNANGQCVEQPGEPEPFCERIRVRAYPTQEYLGLIFAFLGEGEPPPLQRFPLGEEDGVVEVLSYVRNCSFRNNIENDGLHVYFVHPRPSYRWREWTSPPTLRVEETDYGILTHTTGPGDRRSQGTHVMPNISYRPYRKELGDTIPTTHIAWRVPIDDRTNRSFLVEIVHLTGEEAERYRANRDPADLHPYDHTREIIDRILAGAADLDEVPGLGLIAASISNVQDGSAQEGQGAIPDRENDHLGHSDLSVALERQIWTRELRKVAEGKPIKRWTLPPERDLGAED
ncbi:MAG: pobA 2 [Chloroflexi bacterium]|nr:pobA 2 [Chloroflexota bacterium]